VYITAQPKFLGTCRVQIVVDGQVFREASIDGFGGDIQVSVSGTVLLSTTQPGPLTKR
jgi:hypothetical protein